MKQRFSQRLGYKSVDESLQRERMDGPLRNAIWDVFYVLICEPVEQRWNINYYNYADGDRTFVTRMWRELGRTVDTVPPADRFKGFMKTLITEEQSWNEVYDLVEMACDYFSDLNGDHDLSSFRDTMNDVLEDRMSAYRLVGGHVVETTSETDIQAIEDALETGHSLVAKHLSSALSMLSNREQPDYRNSIKESISAVESLAKQLSGKHKASVKDALNSVDAETHPALTKAFDTLYGWTSDADGIRHAMHEDSTVDQADAMFMLVACSAFVNYLTAKSA